MTQIFLSLVEVITSTRRLQGINLVKGRNITFLKSSGVSFNPYKLMAVCLESVITYCAWRCTEEFDMIVQWRIQEVCKELYNKGHAQ